MTIERGERFQSGQYTTLQSLAAGVCREFDRLTDAVNEVEGRAVSAEKAAGSSAISAPSAPVLSDGTLTPAPSAWGYVQHLDKGDDYWLRKNVPQYNAGGSNSTGAIITVRLYHGAAGKYDFLLLEQSLTIAAFVAVYEYDPDTKTYASTPFFIPFIEAVTQVDSTNGYSDLDISHPRITVNDHIAIPIVATFGQGGSAQTVYGDTEKSFVAGNGTSEPESPTLACTHKDIFYDDYTATFTRGYSTADPPSATSCNFYETLEVWIQNLATDTVPRCTSTDPDGCDAAAPPVGHTELCWYLEKEKDLKPRVKRLKNKSESGNWKVKFRIQHPEHRHPRVACRVLDKFGQLGNYNNHANTDESEGVKITVLDSYKDDDGATQKVEYAVKVTVTKDSGAADPNTIRIKAQPYGTTKKFIQDFDYESDADTYTLDKHFKKGKKVRLYVKALYSGGLKSTNWIECLASVTGYSSGYYTVGGAVVAPDAVQIGSAERDGRMSVITVIVPADTKIGQIQIWANTTASNPAAYPAAVGGTWKKIHQIDVTDEDRSAGYLEVTVNRPNAYKKYLAARAVSNEDTTLKGAWYNYGGSIYYFKDENSTVTLVGKATRVNDTDEDQFTVLCGTGSSSAPTYRAQITKVKVRKKLTRVLHAIDCIDPATGLCDAVATTSGFVTSVHHAEGSHPDVYFKVMDSEGNASDWWMGDSGGGGASLAAPTNVYCVRVNASDTYLTVTISYASYNSMAPTQIYLYASAYSGATPAATGPTNMGGELIALGTAYAEISGSIGTTSVVYKLKKVHSSGTSTPLYSDAVGVSSIKFCIATKYNSEVSKYHYTYTYTAQASTLAAPTIVLSEFNASTFYATINFAPVQIGGTVGIIGIAYALASTVDMTGKPTSSFNAFSIPGATKLYNTDDVADGQHIFTISSTEKIWVGAWIGTPTDAASSGTWSPAAEVKSITHGSGGYDIPLPVYAGKLLTNSSWMFDALPCACTIRVISRYGIQTKECTAVCSTGNTNKIVTGMINNCQYVKAQMEETANPDNNSGWTKEVAFV